MTLSEKILYLRKKQGMSQENLAEKLQVSRQAVSRWEVGSALPDASNIRQLSRLFGVTADYLLNDEYESDRDVPAGRGTETAPGHRMRIRLALSASGFGLLGNFVIYILSRFVKVLTPYITYEQGKKTYHWSGGHMGYSYLYFVREHNLEFLTVSFWVLFAAGIIAAFVIGKKRKPGKPPA